MCYRHPNMVMYGGHQEIEKLIDDRNEDGPAGGAPTEHVELGKHRGEP